MKFDLKESYLSKLYLFYRFLSVSTSQRTLGPVLLPAAPGTTPRLAFHRAKLSSCASSWAYSSMLFTAVGL